MNPKFILESFWQKGSNCIAIALIKAAILRYGFNNIFRKKKKDSQLIITLKNKTIVVLRDQDINRMNRNNLVVFKRAGSKKEKELVAHIRYCVEVCLAIMIRHIQLNGYEGKEYTESEAKKLLLKQGMKTEGMHELLGLSSKSKVQKLSVGHLKKFKQKKAVLLYSDVHIVTVSKGYFDDWGKAARLTEEIPLLEGQKAKYWYELK
jgi:hypothetical protein